MEINRREMMTSAVAFALLAEAIDTRAFAQAVRNAPHDGLHISEWLEMDSLGMVAQQKDGGAVLSTLWDVNDASTSLLMSDFYRRWATTPGIEKAEALRQAQLAMLHGTTALTELQTSTTGRGTTIVSNRPPTASAYAHPYYWAPFVLIGNFR